MKNKIVELVYKFIFGRTLILNDYKSFNKNLQLSEIYIHNKLYTTSVDKYKAMEYAVNIIGNEYIIQTYGIYEKTVPDEFDFKFGKILNLNVVNIYEK